MVKNLCKPCIEKRYSLREAMQKKWKPTKHKNHCDGCQKRAYVYQEEKEAVNHPSHYGGDTLYETIKVLEAWLTPEQFKGFCMGNTIKYLSRAGKKDKEIQELKKAKFYLDYEIKTMEEENGK